MAPIVPVIIVAAGSLIGAISFLMGQNPKARKLEGSTPEVDALLERARETGNVDFVRQAAEVASRAGLASLAAAISKRYNGLLVEGSTFTYRSPFPGVPDAKWTRYVNCSKAAGPGVVTAAFCFGLFLFAVRRLCDLQVMRQPKQIDFRGKRVWSADWVAPWTLKRFLADSAGQYKLFVASNVDYAARIALTPSLRAVVGKVIDNHKVSLSGLLAVCHRAGFTGAQGWVANAKDRVKFAATTAAFQKCNGIF